MMSSTFLINYSNSTMKKYRPLKQITSDMKAKEVTNTMPISKKNLRKYGSQLQEFQ